MIEIGRRPEPPPRWALRKTLRSSYEVFGFGVDIRQGLRVKTRDADAPREFGGECPVCRTVGGATPHKRADSRAFETHLLRCRALGFSVNTTDGAQ